ncbi:MAG: nucleotidyltransferase family protein [Proteobacteria bacterium]|nr:nucleotidyltransferase family protein [Pseudomonadota bacterium]
MKALIFAAGKGERMRPLTERTPKPLLEAGGKPLIVWHLEKLAAMGVREVIVNTAWLADRFPAVLGDGSHWGLRLRYSHEGAEPLETGGGMLHALRLLREGVPADAPFLAINGDIWTNFDFASLPREPSGLAHLMLVDNPPQHPRGDFGVTADGRLHPYPDSPAVSPLRALTFAGIGVYRPAILDDWRAVIGDAAGAALEPPRFPLAPLLRAAMTRGTVTGAHHAGAWTDVGTPQRLAELDARLLVSG